MQKNTTEASDELLTLFHTPGLGPGTYRRLLDYFGSDTAILNSSGQQRRALNLSPDITQYWDAPDLQAIERDRQWLAGVNRYIIGQSSPLYPDLLKQIHDPPVLLYIEGDPLCLAHFQLAIVGSRNPTANGKQSAYEFAYTLGEGGFAITSGLALGIDAAAHQGALAAGAQTVAVTGTGLDQIYPAAHRKLAHQITAQGALVSEFALGESPQPHHFPRRNRIISALCCGCLVVEAALKSGSLITARHALEQGREVFAIPGSVHNTLSKGCHHLIRQGALLVENAQDIVNELGPLLAAQFEKTSRPDTRRGRTQHNNPETALVTADIRHDLNCIEDLVENFGETGETLSRNAIALYHSMPYDPVTADTLYASSHCSIEQINAMLMLLELNGLIFTEAGGRYLKKPHVSSGNLTNRTPVDRQEP